MGCGDMNRKSLKLFALTTDNIYQYLIPGFLLLIAAYLVFDIDFATLEGYGGFGSLIFILIFAYSLGVVATIFDSFTKKMLKRLPNYMQPREPDLIHKAYAEALFQKKSFFSNLFSKEIYRHWRFTWFYFSLIMPTAILGVVIFFHAYEELSFWIFFVGMTTIVLTIVFCYQTNRQKNIFCCQIMAIYKNRQLKPQK